LTNRLRFDALSCVSGLMTSLAAALGMMPLAWGFGSGADMQRPLAIAIIAGLIFSLPLVLIVLPALLAIFEQKAVRKRSE
jgi:hydrophobic/amphiphilic exporter-1 (mainly G- bacteria), HAE1 family